MIINKANLLVVKLTAVDKQIPVLDCVKIEENGSSIGGNGKSFVVVSPVKEEVKQKLKSIFNDEKSTSVTITSETAKEVLKNMPNDIRFQGMLEHSEILSDGKKVKFKLHDGARERDINGKVNPMSYPDYKAMYKRCLSNRKSIQLIVNAKRLLPLIDTLMKISDDTGDFSRLYIEFTEEKDIILRMQNQKTGQRAIGLMWCYKGNEAKWLETDQWEEELKNGNNNSIISNTYIINNNRYTNSSNNGNNIPTVRKTKGAKKTGNKSLAHILHGEICPECKAYHLATDGKNKWCSCIKGCNYFYKIEVPF
jgi:hypothetical protein